MLGTTYLLPAADRRLAVFVSLLSAALRMPLRCCRCGAKKNPPPGGGGLKAQLMLGMGVVD